mmetsp:Transcript_6690/g.16716  ORF Transcript_6690/g.16716 Transcript_6690/m.16716 type:complete len:106 (-) Transcript_6690:227-544(-)
MLVVQLGLQFMGLLKENQKLLWMSKIGSSHRLAKHASTLAQFTMAMRLSENSHATSWIFFECNDPWCNFRGALRPVLHSASFDVMAVEPWPWQHELFALMRCGGR